MLIYIFIKCIFRFAGTTYKTILKDKKSLKYYMKLLPLILVSFDLLFLFYELLFDQWYPSMINLRILEINQELGYWPTSLFPFLPIIFLLINKLLKIKTKYFKITIILIIINLVLFVRYESWMRPF